MKKLTRKIHRWLGLLMALQIIAWMVSGLWFSLFPIAEIRGEHLTRSPERLEFTIAEAAAAQLVAPADFRRALDSNLGAGWRLDAVELVRHEGELAWRVVGEAANERFRRLIRGDGSTVLAALDRAAAEAAAQAWLVEPGRVAGVDWVEETAPDSEIRGQALPLWRVRFDQPENLSLYLEPWTGEIVVRRTDRWRIFDFLWMLHIMDFQYRDDFNHPLLQVSAAAGLVIALSGLLLWAMTTRAKRRRKLAAA